MSASTLNTVFLFNDAATTEIYTLSLHDALPIYARPRAGHDPGDPAAQGRRHRRLRRDGGDAPPLHPEGPPEPLGAPARRGLRALRGDRGGEARRRDRKSTRLNSSHANISYAVFCLKKKKRYKHNNIVRQ